ncbi:MAG: leucine-rich repeat domain-containing protein [Prevotellaceae bacterium]|nr:leucine-rich repeat domain-containing protein [Prevotellaceae bacterium]
MCKYNGCSALATVTFQETPTIQTIGNNAFQNCGLTAITIPESVKTIEKEAFNSCHKLNKVTVPKGTTHVSAQSFIFCSTLQAIKGSSIKELYFVGNDAPSSAAKDFNEPTHYPFNNTQKIYVKESKVDAYKAAWTGGVENNITHKIPANTLAFRATACYPFNTAYHTSGDVMPYLPLQYRMMNQLSQDKAYVRARSIDDGRVPAFLGVMLVSENEANASSYCQIDENQAQTSISGIAEYNPSKYYMMGAVEDTPLTNTSTHTLFGLAKSGIFKKISVSGNTIPYFKAYLKIPVADIPMGAKSIHFIFDDNNETTGINDIVEIGNSNDSPYYNLNGVQVNKPSKGVYIHNGKKVIIK